MARVWNTSRALSSFKQGSLHVPRDHRNWDNWQIGSKLAPDPHRHATADMHAANTFSFSFLRSATNAGTKKKAKLPLRCVPGSGAPRMWKKRSGDAGRAAAVTCRTGAWCRRCPQHTAAPCSRQASAGPPQTLWGFLWRSWNTSPVD